MERTIKIYEARYGWIILWDSGRTTKAGTAHAAMRAVLRSSERMTAAKGINVVNRVEWNTTSRLGLDTVSAIVGGGGLTFAERTR